MSNIFAIGDGKKPLISLPKGKGIKLSLVEDRDEKNSRKKVVAAEDEEDE